MERSSAPPKKKKKKDSQSTTKDSSSSKKLQSSKEPDDKQPTVSSKNYAYISPETITKIAESAGIPGLSEDISINLAEDVSYKLQELINVSCTIMRTCKRRKLLTSDISSALQVSDAPPIFGHAGDEPYNFLFVPEADVFVGEDNELDLPSIALSSEPIMQPKPSYVATSWPVMEHVPRNETTKHPSKNEEKSVFAVPYPKNVVVNGDVRQDNSVSQSNSSAGSRSHSSSKSSETLKPSTKSSSELMKNSKKNSPSSSNSSSREGTPHKHSSSKTNGRITYPLSCDQDVAQDPSTVNKSPESTDQAEDEMHLSHAQLTYFSIVAKCILQGPESHFKQALSDLRSNDKLGIIVAPLLNLVAHTVIHVPRHFGLLERIFDTLDALLSNHSVNPCFSIALNRVVNALLAVASDRNMVVEQDDFHLRRRAAKLLARILAEWNVEEQHVTELLSRVVLVLGDATEPTQSQYGSLVIFHALGRTVLLQCLLPLLHTYLPRFEQLQQEQQQQQHVQGHQEWNTSGVHLHEIQGVILDIAEYLYSSDSRSCNTADTTPVPVSQAVAEFDLLLYQYFGDSVCARRLLNRSHNDHLLSGSHVDPWAEKDVRRRWNNTGFKLLTSHLSGVQFQRCRIGFMEPPRIRPGVFEESACTPGGRRKDIHFRFAGANPVPKERLNRRAIDRTHTQFVPLLHGPVPSQNQHLCSVAGKRFRSSSNTTNRQGNTYSLFTSL